MNSGAGGEKAFKVGFTTEGVMKLRERVKEKLKEFMGDYTDDTLVEYVVVLLRNGRLKDEAAKELEVFLGDDNDAFVSWLWDHLTSNLHLYVRQKTPVGDATKSGQSARESAKVTKPPEEVVKTALLNESEASRPPLSRQKRALGGPVQEDSQLSAPQRVVESGLHAENVADGKSAREEEVKHRKRNSLSQPRIGAPRRLLEFALRDVVKQPDHKLEVVEPAPKRLSSVLSTPDKDSVNDSHPKRLKALPRVHRDMAEASEYVARDGQTKSVFARLSTGRNTSHDTNQVFGNEGVENGNGKKYLQTVQISEVESSKAAVTGFDNDKLANAGASRHSHEQHVIPEAKQSGVTRKLSLIHPDQPANTYDKISSSFATVNTPKTQHLDATRYTGYSDGQIALEKSASIGKSIVAASSIMGLNAPEKAKALNPTNVQSESQKAPATVAASNASGHIQSDVELRTIFVSNVHFGASKDALSRHFNKFGAVLKVIILTDANSGQPTGSAYVEFLHKESAEQALSLNGTSFMSRILKVIRKSSPEASQTGLSWPRVARGPAATSRLVRTAYPRSAAGAFRGRLAVKTGGARSMQWKRDTGESSSPSLPAPSSSQLNSPMGRSFTYTRTEPKNGAAAMT